MRDLCASWLWAMAMLTLGSATSAQDANARLRAELERIHDLDQLDRENIGHYGVGTAQRDSVNHHMMVQDSLDLLRVTAIIDSAGWLGPDEIGEGSGTLWLVIQHADLPIQDKYLPGLRLAVEEGKASPSHLAMLEDRVEMRHGRPQIYGSQVTMKNGVGRLWMIRDEETVNERRAAVGLRPLEDYAAQFGINWSPPEKKERVLLLGPLKP